MIRQPIRQEVLKKTNQEYRQTLRDIFFDRSSRNSSYSLRAFARDLGLPSSNLSLVLKEKKGINLKTARQIADRLPLTKDKKIIFCKWVEKTHSRSAVTRAHAEQEIENLSVISSNISSDMMQILAGWEGFAILGLLRFAKNHSISNLSKTLGFSVEETKFYLEKLLSVGLVEKIKTKYVPSQDFAWSPDGVPSEIIRKGHGKVLEKAKDALVNQSVDERDFTSMMFEIDKNDIPKAKKDIRKFIKYFYGKYTNKESATDVYALSLQLFNLTPKREQK